MLKKLLAVLLSITLMFLCTTNVFAHNPLYGSSYLFEFYASHLIYSVLPDSIKFVEKHYKYNPWIIRFSSHNEDNKLTYRFDENVTDYYKDIVNDAAKKWLPHGEITYSASSPNIIKTYYNPKDTAHAYYDDLTYITISKHVVVYEIYINMAYVYKDMTSYDQPVSPEMWYEFNCASIAHEFGHAFGLRHVFGDSNNFSIMSASGILHRAQNFSSSITVGVQDFNGLSVITGQHNYHTFTYFPEPDDEVDTNWLENKYKHYGKCNECGGHVLEKCYPLIAGQNCLKCGRYIDKTVDIVLGDVNEDGVIDSFDLNAVLTYLAGVKVSRFREINADVNSDGAITLYDFDRILQHYIICIGSTEWCYCGLWV